VQLLLYRIDERTLLSFLDSELRSVFMAFRTGYNYVQSKSSEYQRCVALVLVLALVLLSTSVRAHDGTASSVGFTAPHGFVEAGGESVILEWDDSDAYPEAVHELFYQAENIAPTHVPPSDQLTGISLLEVASTDPDNTFTWDLSEVQTGVYSVYAVTQEPNICRHVEFLTGAFIVRHPGDVAPLGVLVTSPLDKNVVGMESASIELVAVSPTQPTLSLRAGRMDFASEPDWENDALCDPFRRTWEEAYQIAEAIPMDLDLEAGPDRWRLTVSWETSEVQPEFYALRAEIVDADGNTAIGWSHSWVVAILGPPPAIDSEATDVVESDASEPEGAVDGSLSNGPPQPSPQGPTTSGCQSSQGSTPLVLWMALLTLAAVLRRAEGRIA
jgi:hypothetical protein